MGVIGNCLHAYPGIDPGKLTIARLLGLVGFIPNLKPLPVLPPQDDDWMMRAADSEEAAELIEVQFPDSTPAENFLG